MNRKKEDFKITNGNRLFAGAAAGFFDATLTHPIDMIKTRMQLSGSSPSSSASASADVAGHSFRRTVVAVARNEGLTAFYKGYGPVALGITPKVSFRFMFFGSIRESFTHRFGKGFRTDFAAGMATGVLESIFIVCPVEVTKIRLQQNKAATGGQSRAAIVKEMIASEGVTVLWRGLPATAVRQGSQSALKFSSFYFMKKTAEDWQRQPVRPWQQLVFGALANSIGAVLNTPVDVAKTRIQQKQQEEGSRRRSLPRTLVHIFRLEGVRGLFRGAVPRVLRIGPAGAIQFFVFEQVISFIKKRNHQT